MMRWRMEGGRGRKRIGGADRGTRIDGETEKRLLGRNKPWS